METGLAIQLGASEEKRRADQYSYLTAVHCLSSSCRSKLALHTFQLCPAIPASQHYAEQRCCCSQQLATNFALLSFPLLSKGTSGSFLQNLRHLDEQLIYSSAQHFFYHYSAALATVLNLSRGQTLSGSSQWFKLAFTVHSSRF